MGKKPSASNDLTKFKDSDAIVQYKNVGKGVKSNDYFPTPDVDCGEYNAAGLDFEAKLADKPKTPEKTAIKNESRGVIDKNYRTQVNYINRICDGNLVMLNSANVILNHENTPAEEAAFSVKLGKKPGSLTFKSKFVKKARSYQIEMRLITGSTLGDWTFCKTLGSCEQTIDGFISGQLYEFRMKIIYSKTESGYFNPVTIRVG